MAIRSAACRACLIASPVLIPVLCGLGTTRRRDAATTAHSTPSTCRATACACSAPVARTRTVLVLSIALSSLLPGAPLCNSCVAVCCSVAVQRPRGVLLCNSPVAVSRCVCFFCIFIYGYEYNQLWCVYIFLHVFVRVFFCVCNHIHVVCVSICESICESGCLCGGLCVGFQ